MLDSYPQEIAQKYDQHAFMWKVYLPVIRPLIAHLPRPTVLDLGCGTGSLLIELSDSIASGLGIDIAPAMIARSREKAHTAGISNLSFQTNNLLEFPPERQFDLVVCTDGVLPNLYGVSQLSSFIARLPHLLTPRGLAIIELWTLSANPKPATYTSELPSMLRNVPNELLALPFLCEIDEVPTSGESRYRFYLPDKSFSYVVLRGPEYEIVHRHCFYRPTEVRPLVTTAGLSITQELGSFNENGVPKLRNFSDSSTVWIAILSHH